jgi:hypothetical protein
MKFRKCQQRAQRFLARNGFEGAVSSMHRRAGVSGSVMISASWSGAHLEKDEAFIVAVILAVGRDGSVAALGSRATEFVRDNPRVMALGKSDNVRWYKDLWDLGEITDVGAKKRGKCRHDHTDLRPRGIGPMLRMVGLSQEL